MKAFRFAKKSIHQICQPIIRLWNLHPRRRKPTDKPDTQSHPPTASGMSLNVMSFNIRRGTAKDGKNNWVHRRSMVHEVLGHYRPDVLGLQEAMDFQMAEISAMLPGYEQVGMGTLGGSRGLHNAIYYDAARFSLSEGGTFWFSDTPDIPGSKGWGNVLERTCTWVRLIEKESLQAFYFYNVHLDHISLRSRKKSVVLLSRHIHERCFPDPFVLTGDFNAREKSSPIQYLKGKRLLNIKAEGKVHNPNPLFDSLRVRYPKHRNAATFHGFRRFFIRLRLDYIFVPSSVQVEETKIIQLRRKKRYPSDHFPLFSRIKLPK